MGPTEVEKIAEILKENGVENLRYTDYGFSLTAEIHGKWYWMSRVFREERDGYIGYQLITESLLKELLAEKPE